MDEELEHDLEPTGYYNGVPLYTYVARVGFRRIAAISQPPPDEHEPVPVDPAPIFDGEETEEAYIARRMREIMAEESRDG